MTAHHLLRSPGVKQDADGGVTLDPELFPEPRYPLPVELRPEWKEPLETGFMKYANSYRAALDAREIPPKNFLTEANWIAPVSCFARVGEWGRALFASRSAVLISWVDDIHEQWTYEQIHAFGVRGRELLEGDELRPGDETWYDQLVALREDMSGLSEFWKRRAAQRFQEWISGHGSEVLVKSRGRTPTLAEHDAYRKFDISIQFWFSGTIDPVVPELVVDDPLLERARELIAILHAYLNDFYSLGKELVAEGRHNQVRLLQHETGLPLHEAYAEAMRRHDGIMAEYMSLRNTVPPLFGKHEEAVQEFYLQCLLNLVGSQYWYQMLTTRYTKGQWVLG